MQLLSRLESRFGLTRGDVTVALFLAFTALSGFIYTTFFDRRPVVAGRPELQQLRMRHDSIIAAQREMRRAGPVPAAGDVPGDTAAAWQPLTQEDAALDDAAERARNPSGAGNRKGQLSGPVNINTAGKEALMRLPGVGEKTALAIIERRGHVPFRRIEDIMQVKGVGEKKFEKMKPYLVVK